MSQVIRAFDGHVVACTRITHGAYTYSRTHQSSLGGDHAHLHLGVSRASDDYANFFLSSPTPEPTRSGQRSVSRAYRIPDLCVHVCTNPPPFPIALSRYGLKKWVMGISTPTSTSSLNPDPSDSQVRVFVHSSELYSNLTPDS